MAIPDFQSVMLPFLEILQDGTERTVRDVTELLAQRFQLTEEDRQKTLPSGPQSLFYNRVAWAKTHLKAAGLIENLNRGRVSLSEQGKKVLRSHPADINMKFLRQFDGYNEFTKSKTSAEKQESPSEVDPVDAKSPIELLEDSFSTINAALKNELLTRLKTGTPAFFEYAVLELLKAMGYGLTGDAQLNGKPGDGGIDGIIREDKLGLDIVCVQAKRYAENTVGRPVIQQFSGSMDGHKAKKGVVLTTSTFSNEAINFVDRIEGKKVVLIDGSQLAELMIEHNVGVVTTSVYEVKALSGDFFEVDE